MKMQVQMWGRVCVSVSLGTYWIRATCPLISQAEYGAWQPFHKQSMVCLPSPPPPPPIDWGHWWPHHTDLYLRATCHIALHFTADCPSCSSTPCHQLVERSGGHTKQAVLWMSTVTLRGTLPFPLQTCESVQFLFCSSKHSQIHCELATKKVKKHKTTFS